MSPTQPAVRVRDSVEVDVAAIHAIYAQHVLHGTASFELTPPTVDEMRQRRADVVAKALQGERLSADYGSRGGFKPALSHLARAPRVYACRYLQGSGF